MELDKSKNLLHVAIGDFDFVKKLLDEFNQTYNSGMFYVDSVEVDGVEFSYIDISETKADHIFLFGSLFGSRVRTMRLNNEIYW